MYREEYRKMKIRNLKYNVALFTVATSLGIHVIASSSTLPNFDEKKVITIEAIELENTTIQTQNQPNVIEVHTLELIGEPKIVEPEYSGMKLSNEYEDEIRRLAKIYNIQYEIVLAIGYRESAGNWNNNGVISKSNDYGVFQINKCNLEYIEKNLGFTEDEVLNDPIKNAEACMFLLSDILKRDNVDTVEEVFGMYNGWVGWRNKPLAVKYSNACCEIINEYFPDFEFKKNEVIKL